MATRYYLSGGVTAVVSPSYSSDWNLAPSARRGLTLTKTENSLGPSGGIGIVGAVVGKMGFRQWVSPKKIGVFNFSGTTISVVLRCANNDSSITSSLRCNLRLYHPDGSFDDVLTASDYDTNFAYSPNGPGETRILNQVSAANVSSQNGDYLVLEIGADITARTGGSPVFWGGTKSGTGDYALTSGLTTLLNPWIEFSGNLPDFQPITGSTLSFVGTLLIKPSHLYFTAALNFVGSLPNLISSLHLPSATLNLSASIFKNIGRTISGSLTSSAILKRFISFHRSGTLSFSGFFRGVRNLYLPATLSFVGANTRAVSKRIASSLNFFGSILISKVGGGIQYLFAIGSNLLFSTSSQKTIFSGQQSTLNLQSGQGGNVITKGMSAGLSLTASFTKFINLLRSAMGSTLNFSVIFTRLKGKFFTAVLNLSGNIPGRKIFSMQSSTLQLSGFTPKFIVTGIFNAILNFIGSRVDSVQLLVQGATEMDLRVQGAEAMLLTVKFDPNFTGDIP